MHDPPVMLNRARSALFVSILLPLLTVGSARAEDVSAAREHFQRGTTAYDLGRFLEAAHEYEAAYEAKPDPSLLFNIGQSYRFVPDYGKAIHSFRAYLRRVPDAPNRTEVETRILEMQHKLEAEPHAAVPATTPPPPPAPKSSAAPQPTAPTVTATPARAERRGRTLIISGAVVAGVGVALVATGGGFVALTHSAGDAVNHPKPGTPFSSSLVDTLNRDQALEATFFAVGGAALVAGTAVAVVGARQWRRERRLAWAPLVQPGGGGAVVAGTW
jgi:tetratricopeptide (TPR) repeat protein